MVALSDESSQEGLDVTLNLIQFLSGQQHFNSNATNFCSPHLVKLVSLLLNTNLVFKSALKIVLKGNPPYKKRKRTVLFSGGFFLYVAFLVVMKDHVCINRLACNLPFRTSFLVTHGPGSVHDRLENQEVHDPPN